MGYAPHHLASQGADCRSCRKRQFGKKSPRGGRLEEGCGLWGEGWAWCLEEGEILIVLYRLAEARHFPRRGKQAARIVGARLGLERGVSETA